MAHETPTARTDHEAPKDGHGDHHGPSMAVYYGVFATLLVLTLVTYLTAKINLGAWNLPLALFIASTKAGLVVAFFMHLYYTRGGPLVSFTVSVIFVITLIAGVFGDIVFRYPLARPDKTMQVMSPPIGYSIGDGADGHEHGKSPMGNPRVPVMQQQQQNAPTP